MSTGVPRRRGEAPQAARARAVEAGDRLTPACAENPGEPVREQNPDEAGGRDGPESLAGARRARPCRPGDTWPPYTVKTLFIASMKPVRLVIRSAGTTARIATIGTV